MSTIVDKILSSLLEEKKAVVKVPRSFEGVIYSALIASALAERGIYGRISFWEKDYVEINDIEVKKNALRVIFLLHKQLSINPRYYLPLLLTKERDFLEDALSKEGISVKKSLKVPGILVRPLVHALRDSYLRYFPGVTANEQGTIKLLKSKGIPMKKGGKLILYDELTEEQKKAIVTEYILRRLNLNVKKPDDIIMEHYLIVGESSQFRDLFLLQLTIEYLVELNKFDLAVALALLGEKAKEKALVYMKTYLSHLSQAVAEFFQRKAKVYLAEDTLLIAFTQNYYGKKRILETIREETGFGVVGIFPISEDKSYVLGVGNYSIFIEKSEQVIEKPFDKAFEELKSNIKV